MFTTAELKLGALAFCIMFGPFAMMQAAAILRGALLTWPQTFEMLALGGAMFVCMFGLVVVVVMSERRK